MKINSSPRILLVTTKADLAADYVILKLRSLGASFDRINTEDFPLTATSTIRVENTLPSSTWSWQSPSSRNIALDEVRCVWFRRHRLPVMPSEILESHAEYCLRESDWFVKGALYSRHVEWMSHPANIQLAESKINQLLTAQSLGLRIPATLITNNAEEVRQFFEQKNTRVIAKPLRLGYFDYGEKQTSVFTNEIHWDDIQDDESIKLAPVIFQELIPKLFDIRVTIVGQQVFAVAIDSQSIPSALIDWRRTDTDDLTHFVHTLPSIVEKSCLKLMDRLGLNFGALDLVLTPEQEYVFLEINPNGQWAWIENKLGIPISDSIAAWLYAHSAD